jgi:hypothetical protein
MAMEGILPLALISALILVPLGLSAARDRRLARADRIGAEVRAAVNRRLRGESLLSVRVTPVGLRRPGRVVLSAPGGYEDLVEAAWPSVVKRVPRDYELVLDFGAAPTRDAQGGERRPRAA